MNHNPQQITVTSTPTLILGPGDGKSTGFNVRGGFLMRNLDASVTINVRFGSTSATPYPLKAGEALGDAVSQSSIYVDVATGTALLYFSPIY